MRNEAATKSKVRRPSASSRGLQLTLAVYGLTASLYSAFLPATVHCYGLQPSHSVIFAILMLHRHPPNSFPLWGLEYRCACGQAHFRPSKG